MPGAGAGGSGPPRHLVAITVVSWESFAPNCQAGVVSELDPVSADCMACHNGSEGFSIRYCLLSQKGQGCGGHIVSADYAQLAAIDLKLRPPNDLPPDIVFHEGKITCVTCHGYDPHNVYFAIDNVHAPSVEPAIPNDPRAVGQGTPARAVPPDSSQKKSRPLPGGSFFQAASAA